MKEFMTRLFNSTKMTIYNSCKSEKYDILYVKDSSEEAYYLNVFIRNKEEILSFRDEFKSLYSSIKKMNEEEYDSSMDKNTSCIVYYCVSNDEYIKFNLDNEIDKIQEIVCSIEEDLYYFKKNVLIYSEMQLNYAKRIDDFNSICKKNIGDRDAFDNFKEDNFKEFEYDFILNLFIKCPFLKYTDYFNIKGQALNTTDEFIKQELEKKKFTYEQEKECKEAFIALSSIDGDLDKLAKWLDDLQEEIK